MEMGSLGERAVWRENGAAVGWPRYSLIGDSELPCFKTLGHSTRADRAERT